MECLWRLFWYICKAIFWCGNHLMSSAFRDAAIPLQFFCAPNDFYREAVPTQQSPFMSVEETKRSIPTNNKKRGWLHRWTMSRSPQIIIRKSGHEREGGISDTFFIGFAYYRGRIISRGHHHANARFFWERPMAKDRLDKTKERPPPPSSSSSLAAANFAFVVSYDNNNEVCVRVIRWTKTTKKLTWILFCLSLT